MTLLQIKKKLKVLIEASDNPEILQEICFFLEMQDKQKPYLMNEEQIAAVEEGRKQIKNGEFLSHEEAIERLNKWKNKSSGQRES